MLKIINWIIPISCISCGFYAKSPICGDCLKELPWIKNPCLTCAAELPGDCENDYCGECLIDPLPIHHTTILFRYCFPITSLITKLKFQKKLRYAKPLGSLLANKIQKDYLLLDLELPECIIPIPLHAKRLRKRGFNQSIEISRPIRKLLNIPIDYLSIKRTRATLPQTFLQASERKSNLKNAFQIRRKIQAKHVAIVDDVVTTFSTIYEFATILRKAGVEKIDVWCLAKAQ